MPQIYTEGEIKRQLAELNRDYLGRKTWEGAYGAVDLAKQQQLSALSSDYSQAVAEAYASAYKNSAILQNSDLGQGYKLSAQEQMDIALDEAYRSYRQNYMEGASKIQSSIAPYEQQIGERLQSQAEMTGQMSEEVYNYLSHIWELNQGGELGLINENGEPYDLFAEKGWSKYLKPVVDEEGNATDEYELKTFDEIIDRGAYTTYTDDKGVAHKEWTGLYDDQGNLTVKGADFFDQMLNELAYEGRGLSFGEYLKTENPELYDWAQSTNPYDFAPDKSGTSTNLASFRTLFGMTSTDEEYRFIERFGGYTHEEVDQMLKNFTDKADELVKALNSTSGVKDGYSISHSVRDLTNEIGILMDDLGIRKDFEEESGISISELGETFARYASNTESTGELFGEAFLQGALGTASGAATGATIGGPVGAVVGGIVGALGSIFNQKQKGEQISKKNTSYAIMASDKYLQLINSLVAYTRYKHATSQAGYYDFSYDMKPYRNGEYIEGPYTETMTKLGFSDWGDTEHNWTAPKEENAAGGAGRKIKTMKQF